MEAGDGDADADLESLEKSGADNPRTGTLPSNTSKAAGDDGLESLQKMEAGNPGRGTVPSDLGDTSEATADGDLESPEKMEATVPLNMEDILKAAGDGNLELLKKTEAENPGRVAAAIDSERRRALHLAAGEGHTEVCEYLIASLKVLVDPRDFHGETPLYKATEQGHVGTVKFLLENKANHKVKSRMGVTTLHKAATIGNVELVTTLIAKDMELNSQSFMETLLACAIMSGSLDCFNALIQAGATPEVIMDPLHAAAKSGNINIVDWFLKAGYDPNACNKDGVKPIQVAKDHKNLDVVELLRQVTLDQASTEASPQRSQFVPMGSDALSDTEIDKKLTEMLLKNEDVFFENWSPMKKRLFYESVFAEPTSLKQILDHGVAEIKNSVIFDMTNEYRAQPSYLRAANHYQAWHFSGSDLVYEIGPQGKRFCVSRKDQTFVFWFRYLEQDVGLVIDGQSLWAEGMLRRTRVKVGRYKYASPIQFKNTPKDVGTSNSKQKVPRTTSYIVHSALIEADYGGRYAGSVSKMKFSLKTTRSAVVAVSAHDKNKSLKADCHDACDNLIFFATEAGKNRWAFEYTMHSLDPKLTHPISVPSCFDGTVTNHQQVSEKVLIAIKATEGKNLKDIPRGGYQVVQGAIFRTLWQCLNAYIILRREFAYNTRFFLKCKAQEYRRQENIKPQRLRHESGQQFGEKVRAEEVRTGTLFYPELHSGLRHKLSHGPKPLKPSRKSKQATIMGSWPGDRSISTSASAWRSLYSGPWWLQILQGDHCTQGHGGSRIFE